MLSLKPEQLKFDWGNPLLPIEQPNWCIDCGEFGTLENGQCLTCYAIYYARHGVHYPPPPKGRRVPIDPEIYSPYSGWFNSINGFNKHCDHDFEPEPTYLEEHFKTTEQYATWECLRCGMLETHEIYPVKRTAPASEQVEKGSGGG